MFNKKLTDEQSTIVMAEDPVLKIMAYAGTGKTSTLQSIACRYPQQRMLYLAFNKALQQEAITKFPANVVCKTAHALAYQQLNVRHYFGNRLCASVPFDAIINTLDIPPAGYFGKNPWQLAYTIKLTIEAFQQSTDDKIMAKHVPFLHRQVIPPEERPAFMTYIVFEANHYWTKLIDKRDI